MGGRGNGLSFSSGKEQQLIKSERGEGEGKGRLERTGEEPGTFLPLLTKTRLGQPSLAYTQKFGDKLYTHDITLLTFLLCYYA